MNFEKSAAGELKTSQKEAFADKKDSLDLVKDALREKFDKEQLPKELILEMLNIRKDIKDEIEKENFVENLDKTTDSRIKLLMADIYNPKIDNEEIKEIIEDKNGGLEILYKDGKKENLGSNEKELLSSLRLYFDSYRLAHNANKFRSNVNEIKTEIIKNNKEKTLNFYSEKEKKEELINGLKDKYEQAEFSDKEFKRLIEICDLKDLEELPIYKIKTLSKINDIFSRFMKGDKTKYVGLSAALLVPAMIEGYAPKLFADAFKDNTVDVMQMVLYGLASTGAAGLAVLIQKRYKDFINNNYKKEGGVSEFVAKNLTELPPDETKKFGEESVKNRTREGMNSYEGILNTISFEMFPSLTTVAMSAYILFEKSPILAGGTIVASGITLALNNYFQKVGKFWEKHGRAERTSEKMSKKMSEQLDAHMEIILAGEKEKFFSEMKEFIEKDKVAQSNKGFFRVLEDAYRSFGFAVNFTLLGVASYLSGGSASQTIEGILAGGNIGRCVDALLGSHRRLLASLRNTMQMELMFNGYAEEENEKEKTRIGVNEIKNSSIELKNVNVEADNKKILSDINLNIPSGSMVYLEGESGAGKTTLMKIISGYYRPTSGEVKFGEVPVDNIKKAGNQAIYTKIAYLSQFPYLLEDSVRNNLKFSLSGETKDKIKDIQIKEVLKEVGLGERFNNLDEKLYGGSGDSGKTSGGETSRLGLARVLLKIRNSNSKLVLLDEPTASVDKRTKSDIAEIINSEKASRPDTTFIVISHDEKFVEMLNCDIHVELKKGKVVQE